MASDSRVGLVLAGGGARGAYQVGALRYLADCGFEPDLIAGTSIGALNAAVLSSGGSFAGAVTRLEELWRELGTADLLRADSRVVVKMATDAATRVFPGGFDWVNTVLDVAGLAGEELGYFDPDPLEELLSLHVDASAMRSGTETWVAAFPSLEIPGFPYGLVNTLVDSWRARTGTRADWFCLQECEPRVLHQVLLASAAIPLAFPRRSVDGGKYVDGGLADNVPLGALAARGCTHVIVVHLSNGSPWSRRDFPHQTVIEIRPQIRVQRSETPVVGWLGSLLDFGSERIEELRSAGYCDAKACLEPIDEVIKQIAARRATQDRMLMSTRRLAADPPLS